MNKKISKFPKGFFQMKRPIITASEALKDEKPFYLVEEEPLKYKKKVIKKRLVIKNHD